MVAARVGSRFLGESELVPKWVWRVKRMADLRLDVMSETELARTEYGEAANMAKFGLRLDEAKRLMLALQVATSRECSRWCMSCGRILASKGCHQARFRSLLGVTWRYASDACLPASARVRVR